MEEIVPRQMSKHFGRYLRPATGVKEMPFLGRVDRTAYGGTAGRGPQWTDAR
jgi:hypothetical protein